MRFIATTALLALAAPAIAQPAPAPAASQAAPVDPARLAVARQVVDRVWPLGTYQRMIQASMGPVMDQIMDRMMGMKAADVAGAAGGKPDNTRKAVGDKTVGELAAAEDPAFRERMRITNQVMMREMSGLMTRLEPGVRDALARAYARNFTAAQLGDLARFFATPSGAAYAAQSMLIYADPEMISAMQTFTPEMVRKMPAIMARVSQATAHLPPPKKTKKD